MHLNGFLKNQIFSLEISQLRKNFTAGTHYVPLLILGKQSALSVKRKTITLKTGSQGLTFQMKKVVLLPSVLTGPFLVAMLTKILVF